MAGNQQRKAIRATRATDRPRRGTKLSSDIDIGKRRSGTNGDDLLPDSALKRRTGVFERHVHRVIRVVEVALDLPTGPLREGIDRRKAFDTARQVFDVRHPFADSANAKHRERRPEAGMSAANAVTAPSINVDRTTPARTFFINPPASLLLCGSARKL